MGTTIPGNQIKGKYKTAILGWSKANCWYGVGTDRIALLTVNNRMAKQIKFQAINVLVPNLFFTNAK